MPDPTVGLSVSPPRAGERWLHKGTGIAVTVVHGGTSVRWKNENGGLGKDSIESFLDRFKLSVPVDWATSDFGAVEAGYDEP